MKICMYSVDEIFKNSTGGIRRFAELMDAFLSGGHEVTLFSADSLDTIKKNGCKGDCIYNSKKKKDIKRISSLIKHGKFDRVIIFDVKAATPLIINGVDNVYIFLRQDFYLYRKIMLEDRQANNLYAALFLKMVCLSEHICLKKAKKLIIQCEFDLNGLIMRHPALSSKIRNKSVIQINNVNPSWISFDEHDERCCEEYDVCFIGNFKDFRKGHDLLLPALKELTDEGVSLRAAIIGDGRHFEEYKERYGSYRNIELLGRVDNPIPVLKRSRLLVVPSYADSCPNTVMEGLYCKVPVIGSNRGGIPEILNNPEWLFELDIESLKEKIKFSLDATHNESIKEHQLFRRNELMFDWGKRMTDIVCS